MFELAETEAFWGRRAWEISHSVFLTHVILAHFIAEFVIFWLSWFDCLFLGLHFRFQVLVEIRVSTSPTASLLFSIASTLLLASAYVLHLFLLSVLDSESSYCHALMYFFYTRCLIFFLTMFHLIPALTPPCYIWLSLPFLRFQEFLCGHTRGCFLVQICSQTLSISLLALPFECLHPSNCFLLILGYSRLTSRKLFTAQTLAAENPTGELLLSFPTISTSRIRHSKLASPPTKK